MLTSLLRPRRTALVSLVATGSCAAALCLTGPPADAAPAVTVARGTIAGAAWVSEVPANWNGTVLLWNHGIRLPFSPDHTAEDAPVGTDGSTHDALLSRGYALLGSSYRSNGFAVRDAVNDDLNLLRSFIASHRAGFRRTFVWGASLGGLVTQTFAEENGNLLAGAAPGCGVLAGALPIADQTNDTLLMVKALLLPSLKTSGYRSDTEAISVAGRLQSDLMALLANPATQTGTAGRLLGIAVLQGLPLQTDLYNGASISSFTGAAAQGVITQASAAILNSRDSTRRAGGTVPTNVGVRYVSRVTPEATARFAALGLSSGLLTSYALTVDRRVQRVAASAAARARAHREGAPTGRLTVPTVTMHTAYDPFVTAGNEALFASRVAASGRSARLLQLWVTPPAYADKTSAGGGAPYGAGHCTFTSAQWLAQLDTLEAFVASGKPSPATVASIWSSDSAPGLNQAFTPLPWTGARS